MRPSCKRQKSCSTPQARKDTIVTDAKQLAFAQGFELVEDQGLLDEVSGLVEWPVVLMGSFDAEFLSIPAEVVRATIRNNQKCFVVRDANTGQADQQVHPHRQHRGLRRRQGHRRRQRARDPRAIERREVLLRERSEDEARRPPAEIRQHRVSREAGHAGRAHQAYRAAGGRNRAAGRRRCRKGKTRGASGQGRPAHRSGRRISRSCRA